MTFSLPTQSTGCWTVARLAGEIDIDTGPLLRDALLAAINAGSHHLVLDMSDVEFIDSSGLNVLVATFRRAQLVGGALRLVITDNRVLDTFRITGLDTFFPIYPSVDEAVRVPLAPQPAEPPATLTAG